VEVPKTGSSSIRNIIGYPKKPHLNICQIRYEMQRHYAPSSSGAMNWLLSKAYFLLPSAKRFAIGEGQFNSYFKFGFVRNPWDRVASLYQRKEGLQMREKMTFEEFVSWIKYSSSTCIHSVPHVNQLDWLVDPHGNVLLDFIGRFETLNSDWDSISKVIGVSPELPHVNQNPDKKHYSEYYTQKTKRIVTDKFRTDIEYFNYTFEG
jgi:hypothetical protein